MLLLRRTRDTFPMDATPAEMALMPAHEAYIRQRFDEGRLLLVGPCIDFAYGLAVFEADSDEEAQAWANADPFVTGGLMTVEVHPWKLFLMRGVTAV